ncbi:MAG: hypothetical protein FWB90_09110 [Fibromonadales bacterium]|nr:hypothetical protein [Fibromonadales bacterium]
MSKHVQGQARSDGKQTAVGFTIQENILPPPADLAKFKDIEPAIVSWMMQYADKEQAARIKLEQDDMDAARRSQEASIKFDAERVALTKSEHGITKTSLWLAFLVAVLFIGLSALLIYSGQNITGTIFGSIALILCVQSFLKFGRTRK